MNLSKWIFETEKRKERKMDTEKQTGKQEAASVTEMAKDPVCGMDVVPDRAAGTSVYKGKAYYFCGPGCKKAFDVNPLQFLG